MTVNGTEIPEREPAADFVPLQRGDYPGSLIVVEGPAQGRWPKPFYGQGNLPHHSKNMPPRECFRCRRERDVAHQTNRILPAVSRQKFIPTPSQIEAQL